MNSLYTIALSFLLGMETCYLLMRRHHTRKHPDHPLTSTNTE